VVLKVKLQKKPESSADYIAIKKETKQQSQTPQAAKINGVVDKSQQWSKIKIRSNIHKQC